MKRQLLLILSTCLLVSTLVGCSSSSSKATDSASAVVSAKPVTIKFWIGSADTAFSKSQREAFMQKHTNIKIETIVKESSDGASYLQALAAGTAPDMIDVSMPQYSKFVALKAVLPLDSYIKNYTDEDKLLPVLLQKSKHNLS